jgi:hypothetical protein
VVIIIPQSKEVKGILICESFLLEILFFYSIIEKSPSLNPHPSGERIKVRGRKEEI